jgi:hypothetical protein
LWFNSKETTTEGGANKVSERDCYEIQICAGKMNGKGRNGEREETKVKKITYEGLEDAHKIT